MATVMNRLQAFALEPDWTRRRFLSRVVKTSAAVAAAAAGVSVPATKALAYTWACCNLAFTTWCSTASSHTCPCCSSCSNHYTWNCVASGACAVYACSECYDCSCSYGYKVCNCC
jgi:hypothetical protein